MKYSPLIQNAIGFAIQTHEIAQKQKRKGKDIPYITHPLTVGLILSRAGADEEVVAAGILHDTIEDGVPHDKITEDLLTEWFTPRVASLVMSVTEQDKSLSWEKRKQRALKHVRHFSHDEVLVKSADVISNASELYADFKEEGPDTFTRFNASGPAILFHTAKLIDALKKAWPESPLYADLEEAASRVATMYTIYRNSRGTSLGYYDVSGLREEEIPKAAASIADQINAQIRAIREQEGQ